jgi:hypothetical protein
MTYKKGFELDDWILHLIDSQLGTTDNTALSLFYTLYSSPLHTISVSFFTSRILATDL